MSFSNNLPPGCSSSDIERRSGDGDPGVDANDACERDENPVLASSDVPGVENASGSLLSAANAILACHQTVQKEPESEKRPTMAVRPVESLEATIAKFNVAFGTAYDVNFAWDAMELGNMAIHAKEHGRPELAYLLERHAENAEKIV